MVKPISDFPDITEDSFILRDMMRRILDTVEAVYEAHHVPMPDRRYYVFGRPAEDCEQLVVSFLQAYLGAPGDQATSAQKCSGPRSGVFNISVSRDFSIGKTAKGPTAQQISDSTDWIAVDTTVLMDAIYEFDKFNDGGPGLGVIATVASAPEAGGGIITTNLQLTLGIG